MSASGPVVVVGDAVLDVDLDGTTSRLAPDAPVPVLEDLIEHPRPGGAALAAVLAASLAARTGGEVVLVTGLVDDAPGERLAALVRAAGVHLVALPCVGETVVKRRVRSRGQSLLRLDSGRVGSPRSAAGTLAVLHDARAVLVADYGHGLLADTRLRGLLRAVAGRARSPLVWDPHPRGSTPVHGTHLVTPNQSEALAAADRAGLTGPAGSRPHPLAAADSAARGLVEHWGAHAVAVTLGELGALLSHGSGAPYLFPAAVAPTRADPCGAGDAFAAAATLSLAEGALTPEAVEAAVTHAAGFVAAGGAAAWSAASNDGDAPGAVPGHPRADRGSGVGGVLVATGGCFDLLHAGHVASLEAARRLGDRLVVLVNSDASVRRLKGPGRPVVPEADRVRVLAALACVDDVVVFEEDTPEAALSALRPQVWAKGGDYAGADLPEAALLAAWGGQVVALPYLEGRSTSRIVTGLVR